MFEYVCIKKIIQTNIRIYLYQNNDTNIEYIRIKNDTNMIRTNLRSGKYSNIFEYPNIRHTMLHKLLGSEHVQSHQERMLKVNPFARALIFTKSGFSEVFWDEK